MLVRAEECIKLFQNGHGDQHSSLGAQPQKSKSRCSHCRPLQTALEVQEHVPLKVEQSKVCQSELLKTLG